MMVASVMMTPLNPNRSRSTPVSIAWDWLPGRWGAPGSTASMTWGAMMCPAITDSSPPSISS